MNGISAIKFLNTLMIFSVLFLYLSKSASGEEDSYLDSNYASKRRQTSQTSGLIPFPRVGRANQKTWRSRILEQIKRREGLIPFPRVGRSGKTNEPKLPLEILLAGLNSGFTKNVQHINPDFEELNDNELFLKLNQNEIDEDTADLDSDRKENLMMQRMKYE